MNKLSISDLDARNVLIADEMRKNLRDNRSFMGIMAYEATGETERNIRAQLPKNICDQVKVSE